MNKYLLPLLLLLAYSSTAQLENLRRKLKVTSCTITKKYYPEKFKDSVEYQKECNSSEVTVFNYDKKGRNKSAYFESKQYTKLNGKDTFLLTTQIVTYNRKGKILTDDVKTQKLIYAFKGESSIYISLSYHYYKYDVFNHLVEENFGNNSSKSYDKSRISYKNTFWGNPKLEMRFDKNEKLEIVDEYFYKKRKLIKLERWLRKKENSNYYVFVNKPIDDKKVFLNDTFQRSSTSIYSYDFEKRLISYVNTLRNEDNYTFFFYGDDFKKNVRQNNDFTNPRIETTRFDEKNRKKAVYTDGGNSYYYYTSDGLLERMDFYKKAIRDSESYYPNYSLVYEYSCR